MTVHPADLDSSHVNSGNSGVAESQSCSFVQRANAEQCITSRSDVRVVRMSDAQRRANAAWLREQLAELHGWIAGAPHRWPTWRIAVALEWIVAGDDGWRLKAADVLRSGEER